MCTSPDIILLCTLRWSPFQHNPYHLSYLFSYLIWISLKNLLPVIFDNISRCTLRQPLSKYFVHFYRHKSGSFSSAFWEKWNLLAFKHRGMFCIFLCNFLCKIFLSFSHLGYSIQYRYWAMSWKADELWFNSLQRQKFLSPPHLPERLLRQLTFLSIAYKRLFLEEGNCNFRRAKNVLL
jgi:hypothetical protein